MNKNINNRVSLLRRFMRDNGLSAYITYSTDPHAGEYVPSHWESRKWLTGFTGSAGTAVITTSDGGLWTDSRYFIQAEEQLNGTGIKLFKEKMPETPSIPQWLGNVLKKGDIVGFDGYTTSLENVTELKKKLSVNGIELKEVTDPYINIWKERPGLPSGKPFILDTKYCGIDTQQKISCIREYLKSNKYDSIIISSLDEIAWTLNMRGTDIHCNPLFVSYLIVSQEETILYINSGKLTYESINYLKNNKITQKDYYDIKEDLLSVSNKSICMSPNINFAIYNAAIKSNQVNINPSIVNSLKAIKNDIEINGFRKAMIKDGVAMVKFLIWLENNIEAETLTEIGISDKLHELRSSMENFQGISFETIAGYNDHGAIVHYEATEETNATLKPKGILLLDSGAQYLEGTTDLTRTIPLGHISEEQKKDYTLVLKGFIQLAMAEFPKGTCGTQLDVLARMPMWREGINYGHGTGHGVGHFLNVHEGPHQIRMNHVPALLLPGMTITNEPGIYRAGKYGIRTENTMLVIESRSTEFGEFYKFEQLTLCPINMEAIIFEMMSNEEIDWLRSYHKMVFERLSPLLTEDEKSWLKIKTTF